MVSATFGSDSSQPRPQVMDQAATAPYAWVVGPVFDYLFVVGGFFWLIFALQVGWFHWDAPDPKASGLAGVAAYGLLITSTLGTYIFADAHTIATYMRIYSTAENRERFKLYAYYLPWMSLLFFSLCLMYPRAAGFCVYLHLMWVFQHYVGQTFGISLVYCYKRGYYFKNWERETYRWFMHSFSAFVITRILCFRTLSPEELWGIKLPFYGLPTWLFYTAEVIFFTMMGAFFVMLLRKAILEKQFLPLPAVCLILTIFGIGLSTGFAHSVLWLYGPPFFHGSQYLAVSLSFFLKEKGLQEGRMAEVSRHILVESFKKNGLFYWGMVVSAGMVIYVCIPQVLVNYGFDFVATATIIQACINFHHFVSDGAIWRLRDKTCREILLA
ncbi:MAG TPA: hypothetical protein PLC15_03680 [Candidatus Obscuribacter sp.]|nr:hypothetical protein [Candidatus Obscuribacter sp.]MBK9282297.1 hypothetical protein [Candidatus Obscuribacter sp.]HMW88592.1 hypothetical protein [Candidatus Obscuribacter sp.]HMX45139.1 hypothetical protein [Candidatus Obscuribacter sp.]HMY53071.1 hypothetical protein [Candidatus Obscuribacter sp.]